jgi:endonuclease/exonuclease/phosphatase (EEP) superfamily protein YafD
VFPRAEDPAHPGVKGRVSWGKQLRVRSGGLFELAFWLSGFGTLAGFLGAWAWWLDLFAHFRLQYLLVLLVAAAVLCARRRTTWAIVALALGLVNLAVMPWGRGTASGGPALRVMLLNVNTSHGDPERVIDAIAEHGADVVLLLEVDEVWAARIDEAYPTWTGPRRPRPDNFGIMLLARVPLRDARVFDLGEAGVPSVEASVEIGGRRVHLIGCHTLPPLSANSSRLRDLQLAALARHVLDLEGPLLLFGDFNATPWSHALRVLRTTAGLRGPRGLLGTWPSLPWPLRIPIDGALVRGKVGLHDAFVGPGVGSDHRPLLFDLVSP